MLSADTNFEDKYLVTGLLFDFLPVYEKKDLTLIGILSQHRPFRTIFDQKTSCTSTIYTAVPAAIDKII